MNIEKDRVVSFHYILRDDAGNTVEDSNGGDAMVYLHGARNIVVGLETELEGHAAGDEIRVTVPAEQGYGAYDPNLKQRIPLKRLKGVKKLEPGMRLQINTSKGARVATVVKVGRFHADLDANHPFAGRALDFEVRVVDVREATEEELQHGHAHGPGGHQH